jgi:hypothetical protein
MRSAMPANFERDFGYLMPFLDKVEKAAAELSDPRAREELLGLMREERPRWTRIRALLEGQPGGASRAPSAPAARPQVLPAAPAATGQAALSQMSPRPLFTVGTLRAAQPSARGLDGPPPSAQGPGRWRGA